MKKSTEAYSTMERTDLLLSSLEKLRDEVSVIEARYDILKADYTKICEDAISKISAVKTDLEENKESEIFKSEISNLEARFKLGIVPAETYLKQKRALNGDITLEPGRLQCIVDKVANGIEFGLDKIGDGMIFPIEKMVNLYTTIYSITKRKAEERNPVVSNLKQARRR